MQVKMIRGEFGCPDGITRTFYSANEIYDLPDDLAKCFLDMGSAVIDIQPDEVKDGKLDISPAQQPFNSEDGDGSKRRVGKHRVKP